MKCPNCANLNQLNSSFCCHCGYHLAALPPPKKSSRSTSPVLLLVFLGLFVKALMVGSVTSKLNAPAEPSLEVRSGDRNLQRVIPAPPKPKTFAELKSDAENLLNNKQSDSENANLIDYDAVMKPLKAIPKDSKDFKSAQSLYKRLIEKVSRIGAERLVMGPKPIQIGPGGGVSEVKDYLRAVLNDYDGSEFVEWYPVSKAYIGKEPYWGVGLRLRARNSFGALVLRDTYYYIRNNQVVKSKGLGVD